MPECRHLHCKAEKHIGLPALKSDTAQLRHFFSVWENSKRLDAMEEVKQAAREIADRYGVKSEDDFYVPEKRMKLFTDKIKEQNITAERHS